MKTGVIYARYSSDNQTEQSIEGQLRVCNEFAQKNNIVIVDTYIDRAMTGTNDNRPDFRRMIRDSDKKSFDFVLVYKLNRFSRNKYETAIHKKTLKDNGVKVLSATENIPDTPEGIILESLLEGMNQYYSAELSQKIKRGMRETRLKGHFQGGYLPYGYKLDGHRIVTNETEAEIIRFIFTEYSKGVRIFEILAKLDRLGYFRSGKPLSDHNVYMILRREKYTGVYCYGGERIEDMYPQIVARELFEKVRAITEKNRHGKQSVKTVYLLRQKTICGHCGMPVISDCSMSHGATRYYYKCKGRKERLNGCTKSSMRKEKLERIVLDAILERLKNLDITDKFVHGILAEQERQSKENSPLSVLLKEQRQTENALNNILTAIERGIMNNTTNKRMKELEARQEELERLILIEKSRQSVTFTEKEVRDFYEQALRLEPLMLINFLVQKIVWYDDKLEIYFNSPAVQGPDNVRGFLFCILDIS